MSAAYLEHLEATARRGRPRVTHQTVIRLWNRAIEAILSWPRRQLVVPCYKKEEALPWSAFPPTLEAEATEWAKVLTGDDLFGKRAPRRPLKPHTITLRLGIMRRVATALVERGHPAEGITGLVYLVELDHVDAALRHLHGKTEQPPRALSKVADALVGLARHHLQRPELEVRALQRMAANLRHREGPKGMSPKARARLRQFDDRRNLAGIYCWPESVMAKVEKLRDPKRIDALQVQTAIAVEILLHAPLRIANLAQLRIGREVDLGRTASCPARIIVPGADVKNGVPLEYELPRDAARLVRLYARKYRPILMPQLGDALFPTRVGGTKRPDDFSRQIGRALWSDLGVRMHPHLFRHLAATQHLRRHHGAYETVSRILGHRSTETAYLFYAGGEETRIAVQRFDEDVLELKKELRDSGPGRRRRA